MAAARRNARRRPPLLERLRDSMGRLRHGLRYLVMLLAVAVVLGLGREALAGLRAMPVERILVTGKLEQVREDALRSALQGRLEAGLLFLDLSGLREELEALPWVYRVQLRRRFPDILELRVVEQLPIARWGEYGFLNHEARIIPVVDASRWSGLPRIRGPEGSEARLMTRYQRLQELFHSHELTLVELQEDGFGQLVLTLDNGTLVQLGNRDFAGRVDGFLHLWEHELKTFTDAVARVDMRYEGGAAVALDEANQLAGLNGGN